MLRFICALTALLAILVAITLRFRLDHDAQPTNALFGVTPARNMANLIDRNIAADWCVEPGKEKNIKWSAKLGTKTCGSPVVAGGRVYVGTNNASKEFGNCVLNCFSESDGKLIWQTVHHVPDEGNDYGRHGLVSALTVEGGSLYYTLPNAVLICANAANGKEHWRYDMRKELKVTPHVWCEAKGDVCSPLVVGDLVFLVTGNGVAWDGSWQPLAPSFLALNKYNGRLVWQSNLPGNRVMDAQWSSPAYAVIQGRPQIIFAGGDGSLYSFQLRTGELIWQFHCFPQAMPRPPGVMDHPYFVATPVIHDNKVYVGLGVKPGGAARRPGSFLCIDATRDGDISPEGGVDAPQAAQKKSALLWRFGGPDPILFNGKNIKFRGTVSTCAIHDGLVYIPDDNGLLHCLNAHNGNRYWTHDFGTDVVSSPYYVDGKIYVGTEDGEVVIFKAGKKLSVINKIEMDDSGIRTTLAAANGVLFVATDKHLYAIAETK